jgi:FkbM family methyltransferase
MDSPWPAGESPDSPSGAENGSSYPQRSDETRITGALGIRVPPPAGPGSLSTIFGKGQGVDALMNFKPFLKNILPSKIWDRLSYVKNTYFDGAAYKSFANDGEDLILKRIFGKQEEGFYVDVGAHHPKQFSNTYAFYQKGWRGINIDAMPGSMELFNKLRPRDINIEKAISDKKETLTYYRFNVPAINSFSKELSVERNGVGNYRITSRLKIETITLEEVLDTYLPKGQGIDFLTIDVEGLDYQVLRSNNWEKYQPSVILIEAGQLTCEEALAVEISTFLKEKGYYLIAKTLDNLIWINDLSLAYRKR